MPGNVGPPPQFVGVGIRRPHARVNNSASFRGSSEALACPLIGDSGRSGPSMIELRDQVAPVEQMRKERPTDEHPQPRFFASVGELRTWLREHHDKLDEQWIGYFKKDTGIPSIDWPQSVDVALCYGWIDGIRKRHDDKSYKIRFTPRRRRSHWSARNIARMEALIAEGLVDKAGLEAFESRDPAPPESERAATTLPPPFEIRIRANREAWNYFQAARPSYRKQVASWVNGAKREKTRLGRLEVLIDSCARGVPIPPLRWVAKPNRRSR